MLNRTKIEEANKHLQALYTRLSELEAVAADQHNALMAKDAYIQTKSAELSKQELVIHDLKHKLEDKNREVCQKNIHIHTLEEELKTKNEQLSVLRERSKALSECLDLLPDLKQYVTKVDDIASKVHELDRDNGYETKHASVSPSLSDEADNTDGGIIKAYAKPTESSFGISSEDTSVAEMARNFANLDGTKSFSVTEDDTEEVDVIKNNKASKEVYF